MIDQRVPAPARLLVVDDSIVTRSLIERIVADTPGVVLAGSVGTAMEAIAFAAREPLDLVILDIEMPGMSGLDAIPGLRALGDGARILVLSSFCGDAAACGIRALSFGASETLAKPARGGFAGAFAQVLSDHIRRLASAELDPRARRRPAPLADLVAVDHPNRIACIGIGASTGGISATLALLLALDPAIAAPVLVTQHLPAPFLTDYARQIENSTGRPARVARDGEPLDPGVVLVAPGDGHLTVARRRGAMVVAIDRDAAASRAWPAIDPMLASIAHHYGDAGAGVLLSGMGSDGALGAAALADAGGLVLAQSSASSVVWGMAGAITRSGAAAAALDPAALGAALSRSVRTRVARAA